MGTADEDYDYRPGVCDAAYQGAPGAFSEEAAWALVGETTTLLPCRTLKDVFEAVASGRAKFGVVPVENGIAGAVPGVAELMRQFDLRVTGEVTLRIAQALVGLEGARVDSIERVYSHPVALAQCGRFLERHPQLKSIEDFDTAGAVKNLVRRAEPQARYSPKPRLRK